MDLERIREFEKYEMLGDKTPSGRILVKTDCHFYLIQEEKDYLADRKLKPHIRRGFHGRKFVFYMTAGPHKDRIIESKDAWTGWLGNRDRYYLLPNAIEMYEDDNFLRGIRASLIKYNKNTEDNIKVVILEVPNSSELYITCRSTIDVKMESIRCTVKHSSLDGANLKIITSCERELEFIVDDICVDEVENKSWFNQD